MNWWGHCDKSITASHFEYGLLYILPGIQDSFYSTGHVRRAFRKAGWRGAILTHRWRYPILWVLGNLMDSATTKRIVQSICDDIRQYRQTYPEGRLLICGYSGGGGLSVMVAQNLPEDIGLEAVTAVHPAISPDYDLNPALQRIQRQLTLFYSRGDWFIVGLGTRIFGTMDRRRVFSAGQCGFETAGVNPEHLCKLSQIAWTPQMLRFGHYGGHLPITSPPWIHRVVAPVTMGQVAESLPNQ